MGHEAASSPVQVYVPTIGYYVVDMEASDLLDHPSGPARLAANASSPIWPTSTQMCLGSHEGIAVPALQQAADDIERKPASGHGGPI